MAPISRRGQLALFVSFTVSLSSPSFQHEKSDFSCAEQLQHECVRGNVALLQQMQMFKKAIFVQCIGGHENEDQYDAENNCLRDFEQYQECLGVIIASSLRDSELKAYKMQVDQCLSDGSGQLSLLLKHFYGNENEAETKPDNLVIRGEYYQYRTATKSAILDWSLGDALWGFKSPEDESNCPSKFHTMPILGRISPNGPFASNCQLNPVQVECIQGRFSNDTRLTSLAKDIRHARTQCVTRVLSQPQCQSPTASSQLSVCMCMARASLERTIGQSLLQCMANGQTAVDTAFLVLIQQALNQGKITEQLREILENSRRGCCECPQREEAQFPWYLSRNYLPLIERRRKNANFIANKAVILEFYEGENFVADHGEN